MLAPSQITMELGGLCVTFVRAFCFANCGCFGNKLIHHFPTIMSTPPKPQLRTEFVQLGSEIKRRYYSKRMFLFDAQKPTNNVKTLLIWNIWNYIKILGEYDQLKWWYATSTTWNADPVSGCEVAWAAGCRVCRGGSHVARWLRTFWVVEIGPGKTQGITWAPKRFTS